MVFRIIRLAARNAIIILFRARSYLEWLSPIAWSIRDSFESSMGSAPLSLIPISNFKYNFKGLMI